MPNPFENNLFLSFLSQGGASLNPNFAGLNQLVQQNIGAQNYAKLINSIIGGGGKLSMDKDNFSLKGPSSMLGKRGPDLPSGYATPQAPQPSRLDLEYSPTLARTPAASTTSATTMSPENLLMMALLNPSASPLGAVSGADLAGLTPQDISQALQLKMAGEEIRRKSINDLLDLAVKSETLDIQRSKLGRTGEIDTYEYAVRQGFRGTIEDWQNVKFTNLEKHYRDAIAQGYTGTLREYALEMAKAGAINLGDIRARTEAVADIKTKKYFTDPEGLSADLEKHMTSKSVQREIAMAEVPRTASANKRASFIESKISARGGKIVDVSISGKNGTWKVQWPDGTTEELTYAIYD